MASFEGPVGTALAGLLGNQVKGHTRIFALLNCDVQVKPATLMVSKVTVTSEKYTNVLMGTVQAAIANGVLDCVREGLIQPQQASELGIIYSVWLDPSIVSVEKIDHAALFDVHREATVKVIRKALAGEPTIEWLLENQSQVTHYFHELGLNGEL